MLARAKEDDAKVMRVVCLTPYRISLMGGGRDYPQWYLENGGAVISTTINHYCCITARYLPQFFEHKSRIVWSQIENVRGSEEIRHPAVREVLKYLNMEGVEIHHDGDLPARSGIGSSSAFTVGLLNALHTLKGESKTKMELALEAIHVEQDLVGEMVGSQDQMAVANGGLNYITFSKKGDIEVQPMDLPFRRIKELESHLMLVFTGFPHLASEIASTYDFEKHKTELQEMSQLTDDAFTILHTKPIVELGKLLHEAWLLKRSLSPSVANPYIDFLYDTAIKAGAIGGKVIGAGGGGFMLLFCEPHMQPFVRKALDRLLFVPFQLESYGSHVIIGDEKVGDASLRV